MIADVLLMLAGSAGIGLTLWAGWQTSKIEQEIDKIRQKYESE